MSPSTDLSFAPLSDAFAQDPYPFYAALRGRKGLTYFEDFDIWLAARFDDVSEIVQNGKMVRSMDHIADAEEIAALKRAQNWHDMPHHSRFVQFSLLDSDGEIHDRLRKQVFKLFTPVMVGKLRDDIQAYVDRLFDSLADRSEIDFIEDLAAHVPGHIIGRVLGVPDEDCPQLRVWSENIVQYFDIDRTDARKELAERNTTEFYLYLQSLKAERERSPKDDLLSLMIEAERAGQMNEDEFISTAMLILMAGHGSTIDVLGSGMHALLKFPDELQRLRQDPSLMKTAVQEMFRYESPLPFFHRYSTEDMTVCGDDYPRGTKFGVLYGAANRDPAQFPDADRFDAGRSPNWHIAFGRGAHFCLGNHLARLDMDIIFSTLLRRFKSIDLAQDNVSYKRGLSVRGPESLRLTWQPA
ncbi:putative cytochrome P450 [Stappia aggregata IAM 12614]|uniref:Putative cytochrome P450 n=1 Tax=Roseibium aggregatum (strain ATCC 25650 / DSM 13394 / JCM 20685 / NBRC 16684 / NCIMB 2208 / IAM 12614 / B1) TaxID=384765 RepID=A0NMG2_ROSAI|nr:cytochrome P450 [Roseibium aggregatum]EAV46257.1 putative cytochrome P450 [Stappia aggregata IAM 12614] [Roseibium aggregatum IAM 12614]